MSSHLRARAEDMVGRGLSDIEIDREIMYTDEANRVIIWQHVIEIRQAAKAKPMRDPNAGPVATSEEAIAAYRQYGSDRKAAGAGHLSHATAPSAGAREVERSTVHSRTVLRSTPMVQRRYVAWIGLRTRSVSGPADSAD